MREKLTESELLRCFPYTSHTRAPLKQQGGYFTGRPILTSQFDLPVESMASIRLKYTATLI